MADTVMSHLPPLGWGDVATKEDLSRLATTEELSRLEARILRTIIYTNTTSMLAVAAIAFGAAKLV